MRRYANKKDRNHAATVALLRGHSVRILEIDACTGIDLLCGYRGVWFLLEIKSNNPGGGNHPETKRQRQLRQGCEADGLPYFTLREGEAISKVLDNLK